MFAIALAFFLSARTQVQYCSMSWQGQMQPLWIPAG
jgi:hypothetical protein